MGYYQTTMLNTRENQAARPLKSGARRGGGGMDPGICPRWHRGFEAVAFWLLGVAVGGSLCSCQSSAAPGPAISSAQIAAQYRLGPGDRIRLTVFNQTSLSNDYTVD